MIKPSGYWPVSFAIVAFIPLEKDVSGQTTREGLPIRYVGEAGLIEMPLTARQLGWMPHPSRTLAIEILAPHELGDGPDGEGAPRPIKRGGPINPREHLLKSECFDLWIFGDTTDQEKRVWLLTTLSAKVVASKKRGLSAAQEGKLILAGRGDIKRFFDRVEEMRPEFEEVRRDITAGVGFLNDRALTSLAVEFQDGPFGDDSFFAKTLSKIESDQARKEAR